MASPIEQLQAQFAEPNPEFGPVPFWWWSGEEVTEERVRWQLQKFRAGGLRNIGIIHLAPTGPQYGSVGDRPIFMSEDWWMLFEVAVREAERLGMRIWFYDQIGFSGANELARIVSVHPEYAGYQLRRYAPGDEIAEDAEIVHATPEFQYVVVRQGYNWLNPEAAEALFDRVHGEMERRFPNDLGRTIAGSFQDELPPLPLWSPEVPKIYEERYGESLFPLLPALFDAIPDAEQIRRRVYAIAAELAQQAFFMPLGNWHKKYGMVIGCDQAGPARRVDVHGAQRLYLDYFRTHRWYNSPGCDMEGEIKPNASIVHLNEGSRVWLEAFHSSGWGGTIEETMHWLVPWLQAGATLFSPHAVYYSTRGGWWEWAPPDTGWRQPYFEHYGIFADTVSRVTSLLSQGKHVADIAVHYPAYAVIGHMSLDDVKPLEHPMAASIRDPDTDVTRIREAYRAITGAVNRKETDVLPGALRSRHFDFDVIDDSIIERSVVEHSALSVAGERFKAVMLCGTTVMDEPASDRLRQMIEAGGLVIGVDVPEAEQAVFAGALYVQTADEAILLLAERLPMRVAGPGLSLQRRVADADIFLLLPKDGQLLPMHQPADRATQMPATAAYRLRTQGTPQLWDPVSGTSREIAYVRDGEWIQLEAEFTDWPAAIIVCADEPVLAAEANDAGVAEHSRQDGRFPAWTGDWSDAGAIRTLEQWRVRVEPTLDNRYGDFDLHNSQRGLMPPERRVMLVRTEQAHENGLEAGWYTAETDEQEWSERLWSESVRWYRYKGETFAREQAEPVIYSDIFGDLAYRSWAGRMGRVPRRFLHLGKAEKGEIVWATTHVMAPKAGLYWARIESNADITCTVNGESAAWSGGPEEKTAWIQLEEGPNVVLLRAVALKNDLVRAGFEVNTEAAESLPHYVYVREPNPASILHKQIETPAGASVSKVRIVFAANGKVILQVNGHTVTQHGDFNPYHRQGQEEVDVTAYWHEGVNEIKFLMPEGEGEVFADGRVELVNGEVYSFCTGEDWLDEAGRPALIRHKAVMHFAETESLWINPRPHPLPEVGWIMPDSVPTSAPLPFVADVSLIAQPVWIRFPLPVGARRMSLFTSGKTRVWVDGAEMPCHGGQASFAPQPAGTIAVLRIEPDGLSTEAAVLAEPIRFEVVPYAAGLGDWRTELALPHHSGAVEYETTIEVTEASDGVLELGHVRGTAEVWLNGQPLGVRVWRPYRFSLGRLSAGSHALRVRVTNTLGTHYEYGRPTSLVGANHEVTYWDRTYRPEWQAAFPSGGLYGPVRIALQEV